MVNVNDMFPLLRPLDRIKAVVQQYGDNRKQNALPKWYYQIKCEYDVFQIYYQPEVQEIDPEIDYLEKGYWALLFLGGYTGRQIGPFKTFKEAQSALIDALQEAVK
jgi:hypothetical protein